MILNLNPAQKARVTTALYDAVGLDGSETDPETLAIISTIRSAVIEDEYERLMTINLAYCVKEFIQSAENKNVVLHIREADLLDDWDISPENCEIACGMAGLYRMRMDNGSHIFRSGLHTGKTQYLKVPDDLGRYYVDRIIGE